MPMKDITLEIGVRLSASSVQVALGAGGGEDLEDIRVETVHAGGFSYSREALEKAFPGAAAFLDALFAGEDDGDGWSS